jgi:hypothetical protein
LERDDGDGHHAEIDHRQGVLPPKETGVEEANTWNHDPDQSGGCEDPCGVSLIVREGGSFIRIIVLKVTS